MKDEPAALHSEAVRASYGEVCRSLERIEDFRGKLLAALPLVSGAGGILLLRAANPDNDSNSIDVDLIVGAAILGVIVTVGLLFFELRGIQRCIRLSKVGTALEVQMGVGGQFRLMPHSVLRFVNEPYASAFIYSAVFAGWWFVAIAALLSDPANFPGPSATIWAAALSGMFFLISFLGVRWFYYHVREDDREAAEVILDSQDIEYHVSQLSTLSRALENVAKGSNTGTRLFSEREQCKNVRRVLSRIYIERKLRNPERPTSNAPAEFIVSRQLLDDFHRRLWNLKTSLVDPHDATADERTTEVMSLRACAKALSCVHDESRHSRVALSTSPIIRPE
jgi:hypothetical protein